VSKIKRIYYNKEIAKENKNKQTYKSMKLKVQVKMSVMHRRVTDRHTDAAS